MTKGIKKKNKVQKTTRNGLPVLDSDRDFLTVFEKNQKKEIQEIKASVPHKKKDVKNKHGVSVIEPFINDATLSKDLRESDEEDFAILLNEYYQKQEPKSINPPPPVPLRKRLKRYPPVEMELDLHGYSGISAQVKLQSFIATCKNQGIFTTRVIVGKGLHSDAGPVLPGIVEDLLQKLKAQDLILWYEWDKKKKLNSGAVIVYLKQFD